MVPSVETCSEFKLFISESLVGKKVLVTGASSGIGQGVALQYAKFGASVYITARREKDLQEVRYVSISRCKSYIGFATAQSAQTWMLVVQFRESGSIV